MSSDVRYPERPSFLDMFSHRRGYNHICLARPGASNFAIRLQIDQAIQESADFVVIGATSSDRIDLVDDKSKKGGSPVLSDIHYQGYNATSERWVNAQQSAYIVSDTINNTLEKDYGFDRDLVDSIKCYVRELHSPDIQDLKDRWIIRDGLYQLVKHSIPFIFIPGPLFYFDWSEFGSSLWTGVQPWDMPDGIDNFSLNHNYPIAHEKFCNRLDSMTEHWD